jgi:hypothetical protein
MDTKSNSPKVLVEFDPAEIAWLADRLHEYRAGLNAAALMKLTGIQARGEVSDNEKQMIEKLEEHKKMEATLRNRLVDKAAEQGFGDL